MATFSTIKFPVFIDCNGAGTQEIPITIAYDATPTQGEISISSDIGVAVIPLATSIDSGLMSPAQFSDLSRIDISTTLVLATSTAIITGNNKCGTIQLETGATGLTGIIFEYDISTDIADDSIVVFSDFLDNFAMGHYQVVLITINSLKKLVLAVKTGVTLELNKTYKWSYHITS